MPDRRVLISGASGLIGSALTKHLAAQGWSVSRLVRSRKLAGGDAIYWNPEHGEVDASRCEGFHAVVNLSGRNVGKGRLVGERKRRAIESRVQATSLLSTALAGLKQPPKVLVSASAIGFYGNRGDDVLTEASPKGSGFMSDLPAEWEMAATPASETGIRVVNLRIAVVLSSMSDPLKTLSAVFRWGIGGPLGNGRSWFSWITLSDLVRVIQFVIETESLNGPVNASSPQPVRQKEFANTLGKVLSRPAFFPVPGFALRLRFGKDLADATLWSDRVAPEKLLATGFSFDYPDLESALRHEVAPA